MSRVSRLGVLIVFGVLLLCVPCLCAAEEPLTVNIGEASIVLPEIEGFVLLPPEEKDVYDAFAIFMEQGCRGVAIYFSEADADRLARGDISRIDSYVLVEAPVEYEDRAMSAYDFSQVTKGMRDYMNDLHENGVQQVQGDMEYFNKRLAEEEGENATLNMTQVRPVGEMEQMEDGAYYVQLAQYAVNNEDGVQLISQAAGAGAIRVSNRLIYINAYKRYSNEQDIVQVGQTEQRFCEAYLSANPNADIDGPLDKVKAYLGPEWSHHLLRVGLFVMLMLGLRCVVGLIRFLRKREV